MSIIFLAGDFPPAIGGIQTYSYELVSAVAEQGQEVAVVASAQAGSERVDDALACSVLRVPTSDSYPAAALRMAAGAQNLTSTLDTPVRCLVATKWTPEGPAAISAGKALRCPFVLLGYGGEFLTSARQFVKWLVQRAVLKRAARCMAISNYTADRFVRARVPRDRVDVIYGGVRAERFTDLPPQTEEIRRELGLEGRPVILTVARLVRRKGHDCVLRALPRVLEAVPEAVYLVVGEGPLRAELGAKVAELGLAEHVRFTESVPGELLPAYYHLCEVFVMPSRPVRGELPEGLGLAFLEASAAAKPVVGNRFGGIPDAVAEGESGLLVEPEDVEALAQALTELLTDPERAQRLGQNGRARVLTDFTWSRVAERFLAALDHLQA